MKRWLTILLALTLPLGALPLGVQAQAPSPWDNVEAFADVCGKTPTDGSCLLFVGALIRSYHSFLNMGEIVHPKFCLPDSLSEQEALRRLLGFIAENPEQHTFTVSDLFLRAMFEFYPCQSS